MNHSYWLIVVFVATIVCNTNSRPQENNVKNIYPVYRPSKELDLNKSNRYENSFIYFNNKSDMTKIPMRVKRDGVTFVRIDTPYNKTNSNSTRLRSIIEPNIQDFNLINKDTNLVSQFVKKSIDDLKVPSKILLKSETTTQIPEIIIKDDDKNIEMNYVPIAISSKNSSVKKWPGDHNGIESLDDLMLYHTYTNNVNPSSQSGYIKRPINQNPQNHHAFPYVTHSKPAIIIIEELTTKRPYYDYSKPETIYSQPIYTQNKPTYKPYVESVTYRPSSQGSYKPYVETVTYGPSPQGTYKPYVETVTYGPSSQGTYEPSPVTYGPSPTYHVPATKPTYFATYSPTTGLYPPLFVQNDAYTTSSPTVVPIVPTTTTKKPKKSKKPTCPNVSVTATSHIVNNNNINQNKEGCNDINININSNLDNSNNVSLSSEPAIIDIMNDPLITTTQRPLFPFFNRPTIFNRPKPPTSQQIFSVQNAAASFIELIGTIFTRLSNLSIWNPLMFPFWSTVFAPLTVILAGGIGLAALMFPWAFPYFWFGRNRGRNRFIILRNRLDKPQKYIYRSFGENSHYLKRAAREIRDLPFRNQITIKEDKLKRFCATICMKSNKHRKKSIACSVCYSRSRKRRSNLINTDPSNNLSNNWWWINDVT